MAAGALAALAACQKGAEPLSPPAASARQAEATSSSAAPIDWAAAGDCLDQLRLLSAAARGGRVVRGDPLPFAVLVRESRGSFDEWMAPAGAFVEADLPLPVHGAGDPATSVPCLLEIGPTREIEAEQRTIGEEVVRSMYQSGTRSERNPDYDVAEARVRQAERDLKEYSEPDILAVGDPMLDLVGILAGGLSVSSATAARTTSSMMRSRSSPPRLARSTGRSTGPTTSSAPSCADGSRQSSPSCCRTSSGIGCGGPRSASASCASFTFSTASTLVTTSTSSTASTP
jgi:hypothetical protein